MEKCSSFTFCVVRDFSSTLVGNIALYCVEFVWFAGKIMFLAIKFSLNNTSDFMSKIDQFKSS